MRRAAPTRAAARLEAAGGRPLRSDAAGLSDEQLLAKLRGFGLDLDRRGLEQLCEGALSAEEVARQLIAGCRFRDDRERMQGIGSVSYTHLTLPTKRIV